MLPLLRFLGPRGEQQAAVAVAGVADALGISISERTELTPSGTQLVANRVHWAMSYMVQAGLTERPKKGIWTITDEGRRVLATELQRIDLNFLKRYDSFREFLLRQSSAQLGNADPDSLQEGGGVGSLPLIDD